ncbi:Ig-like domain-containing protein [Patescibacteria group bacterium]|nr:Ig-like domain-containing protein [Patescibacteria group bacterium]
MIAVVLVLYGGFVWMTAAGDAAKIATAKKILINGVIGLAIILSAFAITHFIVGALEKATGTKLEGPPSGPPGGGGLPSDAFIVKGISPQGSIPIRNVIVRLSFNHQVEQATVNGNVLITKKSDNSLVSGDFSVIGDKIEFTPSAFCPAPNETIKCFDADTGYGVEIKSGLKDTGGKNIYCGAFATTNCIAEFTTGSLIDTQKPQIAITYPDPGQSVSANAMVDVWARATDDAGVSHIEFFADGAYFDNAYPAGASPLQFDGQTFWDTAGVTLGSHNLSGKAYDVDNNNAFSPSISVTVRAEHCFNVLQDFDETGIDCGGADCAICSGGACTQNYECASGSCVNGVCVDTPIILNVSPTDGAPGTYVSILGQYFGTTVGTVTFLGGAGTADDVVATSPNCSSATWTDTAVIVAVPQSAKSGPIQINTLLGTDATNDARGPAIADFLVNSIVRPGICALNPNQGKSGIQFAIEGVNFGASQGINYIKFGNVFALPQAWGNTLITVLAPVLQAGVNSVIVNKEGLNSNAVNFTILSPTAGTKPIINYIDPNKGPVGEYITIFGGNFGDDIGKVEFVRPDGSKVLGDVSFPAICGSVDFWKNASITVKVPAGLLASNVSVQIIRADAVQSNAVSFTVNTETPKPGICGLKPSNGPIGTAVDILGERFGISGTATFYNQKPATIIAWGKELVKTSVPDGAVSGPVKITTGGVDSNSSNFTVGDCSTKPALCTIDQQCCNSSCILKTEECKTGPKEGAYAWRISTGFIPKAPKVIEECLAGDDVDPPSPAPWDARPGGNSACINATVNVRFDTQLDANTVVHAGISSDTIALYKCTETVQDEDPCSKVSKVALDASSGIYTVLTTDDAIELVPFGNKLEKDTQYLVELTTGIGAAGIGGGYMEEKTACGSGIGYCFRFKTRNNDEPCQVGSVLVAPREYTANKTGFFPYSAISRAKADICLIINSSVYPFAWTSSQSGNVSITGGQTIENGSIVSILPATNKAVAETKFETPKDNPAMITAKITTENVSGEGKLTVKFTDPEIVSKWPNCNTACVNATIGAEFNTEMDSATLSTTNINIFRCTTENCNTFDGNAISGSISYLQNDSGGTIGFDLTPTDPNTGAPTALETSRYYFVRLDRFAIKSSSNVSLTGSDTQYVSWQFKTRNDSTPCIVNKINVNPTTKVLNYIGQIARFDSEAIGAPDNCNPQGQKLNPYSYNWNWTSANASVPTNAPPGHIVASTVKDATGNLFNVLPLAGKTCSSACLNIGSKPGVSVCANGAKETGEDCDDNNTINGDGCSNICLHETTTKLNCGDGTINTDEDCDDGNTSSGDGCSDQCLNEGASKGGSVCGNGDIGDGEDCDDGNTSSGDGCSSECLNEGTEAGIASCGNGKIEAGEDCDDSGVADGDGCSKNCLHEGSIVGGGTCGENGVEKTKGEDCDDGNTTDGDGCSMMCLNEGSSLSYKSPSICGNNGVSETGEDCDSGKLASDTYIDPRQYGKAEGEGISKISAVIGSVLGNSDVQVKCDYPTDADCKQFGANLGAGSDYCCYQKANIISTVPINSQTNVCRNTLVSFTFDQKMDGSQGIAHIDELRSGVWVNDAIKAVRIFSDIEIADPNDPTKKITVTKFDFSISSLLGANTQYRIRVENFKSPKGVVAQYHEWQFTTGNEICKFEKIEFIPDPLVFNKVETKQVIADAQTGSGDSISSIVGIYDWTWVWTPDVDIAGSITLASAGANPAEVTAESTNGDGQLAATAKIQNIPEELEKDAEKTIINSVNVIVFLCEYPWLAQPEESSSAVFPYSQSKYNFRTYYCRDGNPLLPYLNIAEVQQAPGSKVLKEVLFTDPASGDAVGLRIYPNLQHLSPLDWYKAEKFVGSPQAGKVDDYEAIVDGRSTYVNAANRVLGVGNFTNIFVISYNQGAGNDLTNIHSQMLKNWKFNINIENIKLCSQSVKSCSSDFDCWTEGELPNFEDRCQAEKDKLTRDVKRLEDLNKISGMLESYKQKNNSYPQLLAGTFLRGWSVSTWPSWQSALGNDLGSAMPADPLNKHSLCEVAGKCSVSNNGCGAGIECPLGETCLPETNYCWNGQIGLYQCTGGSHVYRYQNINQDDYQLATDFEFMDGWEWWVPGGIADTIEPLPDPNSATDNFQVRQSCVFEPVGTSAKCGDGVVGIGEECEKGKESSRPCIVGSQSGFIKQVCDMQNCQWIDSGTCQIGQCGDGVKQATEICDDGQNNGKYGFCNTDCSELAQHCGDGTKNGPEQCDLGPKNGLYASGCSWDCKLPGLKCGDNIIQIDPADPTKEQCDGNSETTQKEVDGSACPISGGYPTYNTRACTEKCVWDAWSGCVVSGSCGNSIKEGTEQCDDGLSSGNTDSCIIDPTSNYMCKLAVCGDGFIRSGKELCDNGIENGVACSANYGLTCNYCSLACTVITKTGDYCGDTVKNGPEQCDGIDFGSPASTCNDYGYFQFYAGPASWISQAGLKCDASCKADTIDCFKSFRINAGGKDDYTDYLKNVWYEDPDSANTWSTTAAISGTQIQTIYQSERYAPYDPITNKGGSMEYPLSIGNGTYKVDLHFAEIYGAVEGERVFDIFVENMITPALTKFDIMNSTVGAGEKNKAIIKTFTATVTDKVLNIRLQRVSGKNGPKISAIEISR